MRIENIQHLEFSRGGTFNTRHAHELALFKAARDRDHWNIGSGDYSERASRLNRNSPPTEQFLMGLLDTITPLTCLDIGGGNGTTIARAASRFPQHRYLLV